MTEKIPTDIMLLMRIGICPVCKIRIHQENGKPTHTKNKRLYCELTLRHWLNMKRQKINVGAKVYEVDARFLDAETAKKLKEENQRKFKN